MKIKRAPTAEQIRKANTAGRYPAEIAEHEIAAWQMSLSDLDRARDQARDHFDSDPMRWHGLNNVWFDRINHASKNKY